jgi:4-amino-4-deoxy-L-arabinose transferase-like glycosyltransferase
VVSAALLAIWCIGMLGRGYWTPDEPREAAIAWRMSWQADKSVPLLAGEAFCEKPPFAYWLAAVPIRFVSSAAWAARLPNLLYAAITALCVGLLARRSVGRRAGVVAAGAMATFLLSYQVAIWLATDAPLLAATSAALLGVYLGFYAADSRRRLGGYLLMHTALGVGFLCKSAAAWMVPALAFAALMVWEKRWRELLRWELYAGLVLPAAMIFAWIWSVYVAPEGTAHLKIFFWNNLVGRFMRVDAPGELQYAAGHRNSPGKYLLELPLYLAPWTLLVAAALGRAWRQRKTAKNSRPLRFALAVLLPPLAVLSMAATARNIYLAPALPGAALLLAWWAAEIRERVETWDVRALRATAILLLLGDIVFMAAGAVTGADAWNTMPSRADFIIISAAGSLAAAWFACRAWISARNPGDAALGALLLAYCALLVGPASQLYTRVDAWQDLASIARSMDMDAAGRPMILFAPDETTRAIIDMYARTDVTLIPGPIDDAAVSAARAAVQSAPQYVVVAQIPARTRGLGTEIAQSLRKRGDAPAQPPEPQFAWAAAVGLRVSKVYALPHGRQYAMLESQPPEGLLGRAQGTLQLAVERVVLNDLPGP